MNISETKDTGKLFDLWKEKRPEYIKFSNDGILYEEVWQRQRPKIAFILKETFDPEFVDIRGHCYEPKKGNSKLFWRNINMWSHTVKQFFNGEAVTFDDAKARKENCVDHIAYINLKKKHESRRVSVHADIQKYVVDDWEFIKHQLRLVSPDVLFCCGTYQYIDDRFTTTDLGNGVYRSQNLTIIDFYHPSCRKGYNTTFEILKKKLANLPPHAPNIRNANIEIG